MTDEHAISDHWAQGDVFARILAAMEAASIPREGLTVEALAPLDHFHARGFAATKELADLLPIAPDQRILDIGCGIGGPARYLAHRFGCTVDGIDITAPFVEAANGLNRLTGLTGRVRIRLGNGAELPYPDQCFDGAYSLHVTMNVPDRAQFFGEAMRVLKPGAFFALTEHGLGPEGDPHHPVPWSEDGSGAFLIRPAETVEHLRAAGFEAIEVAETGAEYLAGYRRIMELAEQGALPAFGTHILLGEGAPAKTRNAARNIAEGRTQPIRVLCRRPV